MSHTPNTATRAYERAHRIAGVLPRLRPVDEWTARRPDGTLVPLDLATVAAVVGEVTARPVSLTVVAIVLAQLRSCGLAYRHTVQRVRSARRVFADNDALAEHRAATGEPRPYVWSAQ